MVEPRIKYDSCPLCASESIFFTASAKCDSHPLYKPLIGATMRWNKCGTCSHVFTEGYFTDDALALIFRKTNESQKVGHKYERKRFVATRMIERVSRGVSGGMWLDIGFGDGSLLMTAKEFGFNAVGVDLRAQNVADLKRRGIEAYCDDFKNLRFDETFDVVSMCDVLEHIPFPKAALSAVGGLIRPGGTLLLSMPNMDAPIWEELDRSGQNPYWGEIEHYHNFGRRRLFALLEECGFEPVKFGISERYRACMEVIAIRA